MDAPSANGSNGRTAAGRFAAGNRLGLGNPYAKRTAQLRGLLLDSVTDNDLRSILSKLVEMAKAGDLTAAREILDRTMGKPKSTVEIEQAALSEVEIDAELDRVLHALAKRHIDDSEHQETDLGTG
jgi:hypothetical protein